MDLRVGRVGRLKKTETEDIKSFLSRTTDKVRLAYGRKTKEHLRTRVFIATTNKGKDNPQFWGGTGNRRWWPVEVTELNEETLIRDRDQLLAEAAYYEAQGESLHLDRDLWAEAREEQEKREMYHPWQGVLARLRGIAFEKADGSRWEWIATEEVLSRGLNLSVDKMNPAASQTIGGLMPQLGWKSARRKVNGVKVRGYEREFMTDPWNGEGPAY
jgi:predicted P-loop ATPase